MKKPLLLMIPICLAGVFAFTELGFPDLQPEHSPAASYANAFGNTVTCGTKAVLINSPISGSSAFKVGFYLSTDSTISTTDLLIGSVTVTSITPNQSVTCVVHNINLASLSVPTGTYYIGTYIDKDNQIAENGMTPELENNGWAFRNSAGALNVITYPALNAGVDDLGIMPRLQRSFSADGDLNIVNNNNQPVTAELRSIDGKLLERQSGSSLSFGKQPAGIYLLVINPEGRAASEKFLWQ
jgi:hypothetical protein